MKCTVPENIHKSHMEGFCFAPPSPQEIPVYLHTSLLKFWLLRPPSLMTFLGVEWIWIFSGTAQWGWGGGGVKVLTDRLSSGKTNSLAY